MAQAQVVRTGDRLDPRRVFEFVNANRATYPVTMLCRLLQERPLSELLDVSTSGYYAWLERPPSTRAREDAVLTEKIREIHLRFKGTYGAPRVYEELKDEGVRVGWVGPQESLPEQAGRWSDLVVLRGGIRVSNDEDLGAYEHIRYVLGLMWDSDGDGSPEAYSCGPGAASVLAVVP